MKPATAYDLEIMAKTIWGEARGSSDGDRLAVAFVMLNRAQKAFEHFKETGKPHPLFGNGTPAGACLQKWQFSCWNANDPNRKKMDNLSLPGSLGDKVFRACMWAAIVTSDGFLQDTTKGSTHYHTVSMGWPNAWGQKKEPVAVIGAHAFYNNID